MAENKVVGITIDVNGTEQVLTSMKDVRGALKQAKSDLLIYTTALGETSAEAQNAAMRVKELEDAMGDAAEFAETFNPDKPFAALTGATQGAVAGISAVQGAMGLLGSDSKNVEKLLLKVNSAMALQQGIEGIAKSINSFKLLGQQIANSSVLMKANAVATNLATGAQKLFGVATTGTSAAFKILKGAIAATGIGLLVVAVGTLVAYWDDIKGAISGVSSEQKKLLSTAEANKKSAQEKLDALDNQENILKLQGKSEEDILKIKYAQTQEVITATKEQIKQQIQVNKAQVEAEKRNKSILKGILQFLTAPLEILVNLINSASELLGIGTSLPTVSELVSSYAFDADAVQKEGDAAIKELQSQLTSLENQAAGHQLALKDIQKKGNEKRNADAKKANEERIAANTEANKRIADINKELELLAIKDEDEKAKKQLEQQRKAEIDAVNQSKADAQVKKEQIAAINQLYDKKEEERLAEQRQKEKEQEAAFQQELSDIRLETKLAGMTNEREKEKEQLQADYDAKRQEVLSNEELTEVQKQEKLEALRLNFKAKRDAQDQVYAEEDAVKQLDEIEKIIGDEDAKYQVKLEAINKERALLEELKANKLISEEDYVARKKVLAKAEVDIDTKKQEALAQNAEKISSLLGGLSNLFGKQTAAGKAFAIAQAVIDTYLSANKAYASLSGIPVVGPALGAVAAGAAIAGGIKNVKEILKVKVPAASGVSNPSISTPSVSAPIAPQRPQASLTQLDQQSINQLGSATNRSYVVESDITNSQERITRINRAARLS
jgi:hypothetical protein